MNAPDLDQLIPDARAFIEAKDAARAAYDQSFETIDTIEEYTKRRAAADQAHADYNTADRAAWDALKESSNPLVAWIGVHADRWPSEATTALRHLTPETDLAYLDELAENHGWCSVWGGLRRRMVADGVIQPVSHQIQTRINGGAWEDYWEYQARGGVTPFPRELLDRLAEAGVTFLTANINGDHLMFQIESPRRDS